VPEFLRRTVGSGVLGQIEFLQGALPVHPYRRYIGREQRRYAGGVDYFSEGLDPAGLVTHVGGINAVIDTTLRLPEIPGGKKLIYNHIEMPLTPISAFGELGKTNPVFAKLDEICTRHKGLWSVEAEAYLMENAGKL
jgi:hypothetical protein